MTVLNVPVLLTTLGQWQFRLCEHLDTFSTFLYAHREVNGKVIPESHRRVEVWLDDKWAQLFIDTWVYAVSNNSQWPEFDAGCAVLTTKFDGWTTQSGNKL